MSAFSQNWWGDCTTSATSNVVIYPTSYYASGAAIEPPAEVRPREPETAVEWLRREVAEVCGLAA
jgi:hypothetical protein